MTKGEIKQPKPSTLYTMGWNYSWQASHQNGHVEYQIFVHQYEVEKSKKSNWKNPNKYSKFNIQYNQIDEMLRSLLMENGAQQETDT